MENILKRIEKIVEIEGITITSLERKIGASKGVLSRAIAKNTDIQSKWIQLIVENYPQYSATWLLTGFGDMFAGHDDKNIDNELNTAVQELTAEGKNIGGSVPYEFVERLFREREQHDRIIQSLQSTIKVLQNTIAELSQALKKS